MIHHIITASRLALSPVSFYYLSEGKLLISLAISIYAIISDGLDGFFSRKHNESSSFGAIFDVIADKTFLYFSILGALSHFIKNSFFDLNILIVPFIWILRDIILTSLYLYFKKKFKSLIIGKIYTTFQFIFILIIIFLCFIPNHFIIKHTINLFSVIFAILATLAIENYYTFFKKSD